MWSFALRCFALGGRAPRVGLLLWLCAVSTVTGTEISRVRWFSAPDHTRVVLDLDQPATYEVRDVSDPHRVVINVPGAVFKDTAVQVVEDGLVRRLRSNGGRTRAQVVIDLGGRAPYRHFTLPAAEGRPARIVIDVQRPVPTRTPLPPPTALPTVRTVVIDPGHGGLDPGATFGDIQEKSIVLDVARRVVVLLQARPNVAVVLTRDRDWYPSLADRVAKAAAVDGDLFVSIHCNAHRRATISGMEVYFLSLQRATDREAQELADAENAADLVGVASREQADDAVLSILMDLHMTRILSRSNRLSTAILEAARARELAPRRVKQAGFQVLRSLAMPSALVELAYLTNPDDRRLLTTASGRQTLAEVVASGIGSYLDATREGVVAAAARPWSRHYKVSHGDNLWRLARRHGTTVDDIRRHNNLLADHIQVGQYLSLPEGRTTP